jgi:alpha-ribazole phosphatase/probable phosphoglycerate mutase
MQKTIVDLLRHGEPVGGRRYRGQIDDPLSEKGWQQMRDAVSGHRPWDVVVSSPLSRCREFAQELCERNQLSLQLDERLQEIGFGEWEGRTAAEITAQDPRRLLNFYQDPQRYRPRGAERLTDFEHRVVAAWDELLEQYVGGHVLVVGHAGMMRMIICHVLGAPLKSMFHIQIPNAGITRIQVDGEGDELFSRLLFHAGKL